MRPASTSPDTGPSASTVWLLPSRSTWCTGSRSLPGLECCSSSRHVLRHPAALCCCLLGRILVNPPHPPALPSPPAPCLSSSSLSRCCGGLAVCWVAHQAALGSAKLSPNLRSVPPFCAPHPPCRAPLAAPAPDAPPHRARPGVLLLLGLSVRQGSGLASLHHCPQPGQPAGSADVSSLPAAPLWASGASVCRVSQSVRLQISPGLLLSLFPAGWPGLGWKLFKLAEEGAAAAAAVPHAQPYCSQEAEDKLVFPSTEPSPFFMAGVQARPPLQVPAPCCDSRLLRRLYAMAFD